MTYSLNTFNPGRQETAPPRSGWSRFANELALLAGLVLLVFWLLAMLTYSAQDAAWSTSGIDASVRNRGGRIGALLADASYFLFGFSVWWCFFAGVRAWLTALARWMRGQQSAPPEPAPAIVDRLAASRIAFWCGLALLLCGGVWSAALWQRFIS